jgi:hypothetical protein
VAHEVPKKLLLTGRLPAAEVKYNWQVDTYSCSRLTQ